MIRLYDNAIAKDLENSFDLDAIGSPCVKVLDADSGLKAVAQEMDDKLQFPLVLLTRYPDISIDTDRMNFTRLHRGVAACLDPDTNNLYYEKAIPIEVSYDLTVLATNVADREELLRELLFKYTDMYFITMELPYECKRRIRFGVTIDFSKEITNKSGVAEYLGEGTLYESIIPLKCEGCVLVSYTPAKIRRNQYGMDITKNTSENLK